MNIRMDFRCKDLLQYTGAWYSLLKSVSSLNQSLPLQYLGDDQSKEYDVHSLYIKTLYLIQEGSFISVSSPANNNGEYVAITAYLKTSDFHWPQVNYYNICIYLPEHLYDGKKNAALANNSFLNILGSVCEIIPAYKAVLHHPEVNYNAVMQYMTVCNVPPAHALPVLDHPAKHKMDEFIFPTEISWIGYWGKQIVEYIGIKSIKRSTFYRASFTKNGGFIYQATQEPLHKKNPSHMEILRRNYLQMEKIGAQDLLNSKAV